jgi:hypothetical protein
MCHSDEVEYEFVVDGSALSRCRACTLLFANPPVALTEGPPIADDARHAYAALRTFARRYLGREATRVLIVSSGPAPHDPHAEVRNVNDLEGSGTYDLVVAWDVLERDPEPLTLATRLRALISEGGALLVTTPSTRSRSALGKRESWSGFRSRASWWFNPDTLQLLLTRAGFGQFATLADPQDLGVSPPPEVVRFFDSHAAAVARPVVRDQRRTLSVIIPVYNEAATCGELIERVLNKTIPGVEIEAVIVESNSQDGSREIVRKYVDHPRVRTLFEDGARGKGSAVRRGFELATGEVILIQDADLEYDVNDYDVLVEPLFALRRCFVLGSRHGANGDGWKIRRFDSMPVLGSIMNVAHLALLTLFNTLYGTKLFDPFTMFKVFRADCLFGLYFECNRFDFDYEIACKLIRRGHHVIEIPVNYRSRSYAAGKKTRFFADPPQWVKAMLRLRSAPLYRFPPEPLPADATTGPKTLA